VDRGSAAAGWESGARALRAVVSERVLCRVVRVVQFESAVITRGVGKTVCDPATNFAKAGESVSAGGSVGAAAGRRGVADRATGSPADAVGVVASGHERNPTPLVDRQVNVFLKKIL
jgi:hypothetical protein